MAADIAKINARWKKGCLLAFVAALWLFHITTAVWFVAHCEPTEAEVLKREAGPTCKSPMSVPTGSRISRR